MHALRSTNVLIDNTLTSAVVLIESGRIYAIQQTVPDGVPCEDLGDLILMAGLVDCHVHINEPGRTEWEGFTTATKAAAAGGVTTVVDMPLNCIPVTTSGAALQTKLEAAEGFLWVDTGFWGGVVPGNLPDIPGLAEGGVLGAKAFMCFSGIDDFQGSDESTLRAAMGALKAADLPLLVHAELELPVEEGGDPTEYATFLKSRPNAFEDQAIAMIINLCRETGCRVHIVHLSSGSALPMITAARAEGLPLTVETCPHYLCLTAEEVPDGDTAFKCCPPIRESANRELLWKGLADGVIDIVVTDHSPCTPHLKLPERGDFMDAWGGISSLQFGLSNVWTEAQKRGFTVADIARWMSANPAAMTRLNNRKGSIAVGLDADFVVWDPDGYWTLTTDQIHHRHKVTPYVGRALRGVVHTTWIRGNKVWNDGQHLNEPIGKALLHT